MSPAALHQEECGVWLVVPSHATCTMGLDFFKEDVYGAYLYIQYIWHFAIIYLFALLNLFFSPEISIAVTQLPLHSI